MIADIISNIKSIHEDIGEALSNNPSVDWIPEFDELEKEEELLIGAIENETGFTVPEDMRKFVIEKAIKNGGI